MLELAAIALFLVVVAVPPYVLLIRERTTSEQRFIAREAFWAEMLRAKEVDWTKERGDLLGRIMSHDYTEYVTMHAVEAQTEVPGVSIPQYLNDADEARMEREARGEK